MKDNIDRQLDALLSSQAIEVPPRFKDEVLEAIDREARTRSGKRLPVPAQALPVAAALALFFSMPIPSAKTTLGPSDRTTAIETLSADGLSPESLKLLSTEENEIPLEGLLNTFDALYLDLQS